MTAQAVVVLRPGIDDATSVICEARASLAYDMTVEAFDLDFGSGVDVEAARWRDAQLFALSPALREDPAAAHVVASVEDRFVRLAVPSPWSWYLLRLDRADPPPWPWIFTCNICGAENQWSERPPGREGQSCRGCASNGRYRATVRAVVRTLLDRDEPLSALSPALDGRGLGIGDWPGYADRLATVFDYTNTHLDTEPRIDLTEEPDAALCGIHDFVIAGDVLEHVAPPVEAAMANLCTMLRPGGVAIVTVPFSGWREHVEHFPHLCRWGLETEEDGEQVLVNERADGQVERFRSLCFHGPGRSLEMRVFTEASFVAALRSAGFEDVRVANQPSAKHGVLLHDWPGPVVARR